MLDSISPYVLLCASKPHSPASFTTSYDLRSAAQNSCAAANRHSDSPAQPILQTENAPAFEVNSPPLRRTHYIAAIHERHTIAAGRSQLSDRIQKKTAAFQQPFPLSASASSIHLPEE